MPSPQDFAIIGLLVFLEGILSLDNAMVLALLAKPLPKPLQKRALTYGLFGAIAFRLLAIGFARLFIHWTWVKFLGAAYLLWLSIRHLLFKTKLKKKEPSAHTRGFWKTVAVIELTDIAFAVDSILAAVALSRKYWVVFAGGMLGVILMRFAAVVFLRLLERFPHLETTAYTLVLIIGCKLAVDGFHFTGVNFNTPKNPAFWVLWGLMLCSISLGLRPSFPSRRSSGTS